MPNTFQIWKELQANCIEPINIQHAQTFTSTLTQSNNSLLQFTISINLKKVEWNKLVRTEEKDRKYVLGQRRKSLSNDGAANWILLARINL